MKIFDFDEKFYEYTTTWMAMHPNTTAKQVEERFEEIRDQWLNAPASWLGGETPATYFNRYTEPKELIKLVTEYVKRELSVPEPLYSSIVDLGESCAEGLLRVAANEDNSEALRAEAMALLRDIGTDAPRALFVQLVVSAREPNELSDMSADILSKGDASVAEELLDRYEGCSLYGQMLILDICCNFPGLARVYDFVTDKLRTDGEHRALYASLLGKLGDERAVEVMRPFLDLTDLSYFDYIELRNAIEELGGDAGEERTFYGDPDYEAMRNM